MQIQKDLFANGKPSEKVIAANNLANHYFRLHRYDSASFFANWILSVKEVSPSLSEKASALYRLATIYHKQGRKDEAFEQYTNSLGAFKQVYDTVGQVKSLTGLGVLQKDRGDFESSKDYFEKSIRLSAILNDSRRLVIGYLNFSNTYKHSGEYVKALELLDQAQSVLDVFDDTGLLILTYSKKAAIYGLLEEPYKANNYLKQALELSSSEEDPWTTGHLSSSIGANYLQNDSRDSAFKWINASIELNTRNGDTIDKGLLITDYHNLALLSVLQQDYKSALDYSSINQKLIEDFGTDEQEAENLVLKAKTYLQVENKGEAFKYAKLSLKSISKLTPSETSIGIYYDAESVFRGLGKLDFALAINDSIALLWDEVNQQNKALSLEQHLSLSKSITQRTNLLLEKSKLELSFSRDKAIQQRLWFLIGFIFLIVCSIGVYLLQKFRNQRKLALANQRLAEQELKAQKEREQASRAMEQAQKALLKDLQTVFHNQVSMTGFYLQTLIEQLKKKHPGELSQQIDQYVQRLIYRAKHATDEKLQDLYKHGLEAGFFTLIDRFEDDHNFIVEMDLEGIDVRYDLQTEMKLIQAAEEFLTNALKYSKHSTAKLIFRAGDQFVLQVIDPGEGFKVDQRSSTGIGIGLDLINSIALTMNGTVNYSKTTDGFVAKLILPKREA